MLLAEQGAKAVISSTVSRSQPIPYSKRFYRQRNLIERMFARLKEFRRIATRYDKLARLFLAGALHRRSRNLVAQLSPDPSVRHGGGEHNQKHDQDLHDTCVMLLDRAGCDLLTICDITGHSDRSAHANVKHYRARNAARADFGIDGLELQVPPKEGMKN